MAATMGFPPVTYSSIFVSCLLQAAANGDAKAVELTKILQHKQENLNKNKKDLKRRWKEITRSALCGSEQKELTEATTSIDFSPNRSNGDRSVDMQQLTLLQLLALLQQGFLTSTRVHQDS
ncbi:uncharacterized protein LOC111089148 isoform X2 [Limulus polyphemus]|uniref:Uncharacterized protein LOC111089148 isoform X2 n=1 Tax=Limulus polyphemus TaxID=6850 RepID=A0ABM1TLL5_LIMPO|nr:uncharacterized protein LOC111089148 isoform X2 [Limulus polyphemus]